MAEKPNVVIMFMDDMGYADIGAWLKNYPAQSRPHGEGGKEIHRLLCHPSSMLRFTCGFNDGVLQ